MALKSCFDFFRSLFLLLLNIGPFFRICLGSHKVLAVFRPLVFVELLFELILVEFIPDHFTAEQQH